MAFDLFSFVFSCRRITSLDNHQQLPIVGLCCLWQGLLLGTRMFESGNGFFFFPASLLKSCKFVSRLFFSMTNKAAAPCFGFGSCPCFPECFLLTPQQLHGDVFLSSLFIYFRFEDTVVVGFCRVGMRMCGRKISLLLSPEL